MADKNIYLIARYVAKPKDPSKTSQKGYMTNPENIMYNEEVAVVRGLKARDLQFNVILNLTEEKIIRNSFDSGASFEDTFKYFYEGYEDYINESVNAINGTV